MFAAPCNKWPVSREEQTMRPAPDRDGDLWAGLMRAALAGDEGAYRMLLNDLATVFRGAVRARLGRRGQGNADIEDIVQETLLAIHLKRHTWDTARPFRPWANAVLAHKLADRCRHQAIRRHEDVADHADHLTADAPESGTVSDIDRVLARLDPAARALVTAISIEGQSAAEVARATGRSEGAVRVALHRALARLSSLFRETAP